MGKKRDNKGFYMNVLEVATGTGLIAINIASYVRHVEATDFSPKND